MDEDLERAILRAYENTDRSREETAAMLESAAAHCAELARGLRLCPLLSPTAIADAPPAEVVS